MVQQIINALIPIIVTAVGAVLCKVIYIVGDALVAWLAEKKNALVIKIGADSYNQNLAFAKAAWDIVDEYFRITPNITKTIDAAQVKFAEELKKLVPSLTEAEIESLRQAIAGEVNKGRDVIIAPTDNTPKTV